MNLKKLIREALEQHLDQTLILKENVEISEALQYHIDNGLSLTDNVFRVYSEGYFDLVNEVRALYNEGVIDLNEEDRLMVESDLGKRVKIGNEIVYLDAPYIYETETEEDILAEAKHHGRNVKLGKPFRTPDGPKKFSVYVRNDKNNIVKVNFGDPNMKIKKNIPERRKSFRARHNCDNPGPRWKARYWSCRAW